MASGSLVSPDGPSLLRTVFWYPMLMEHGDHYGRKLFRPGFPGWFFSILVHLFANRYYERFWRADPLSVAPPLTRR